jgi:hypothetical protein
MNFLTVTKNYYKNSNNESNNNYNDVKEKRGVEIITEWL